MKIGVVLYGIFEGDSDKLDSPRDWRHCWPNIKEMVVDPFKQMSHEVLIYISTYHLESGKYDELYDAMHPKRTFYSERKGSDAFTAKFASFNMLEPAVQYMEADFFVMTRIDAHWSKVIARDNINPNAFNFLFKEQGWWDSHQFTCDNFYAWPANMTIDVRKAMQETYKYPRGNMYVDTHGLIDKLSKYIPAKQMHIISEIPEISDVNSYYTCCRKGLPEDGRGGLIHPEVKERYNYA